jgi:hypothetical protein
MEARASGCKDTLTFPSEESQLDSVFALLSLRSRNHARSAFIRSLQPLALAQACRNRFQASLSSPYSRGTMPAQPSNGFFTCWPELNQTGSILLALFFLIFGRLKSKMKTEKVK